jgi:hypothetical protein
VARRMILIGAVLAVVLTVSALLVWPWHLLRGTAAPAAPAPRASANATSAAGVVYSPGGPLPAAALATCRQLVSGTAAQQRSALAPALAAALPAGPLLPAGSSLTMIDGSWHVANGYANAAGTLQEPGEAARQVRIGFAQQPSGAWLVTFEEASS